MQVNPALTTASFGPHGTTAGTPWKRPPWRSFLSVASQQGADSSLGWNSLEDLEILKLKSYMLVASLACGQHFQHNSKTLNKTTCLHWIFLAFRCLSVTCAFLQIWPYQALMFTLSFSSSVLFWALNKCLFLTKNDMSFFDIVYITNFAGVLSKSHLV